MVISFLGRSSDIRALRVQWDLMARGGEDGEDMGLRHEADHTDLHEVDTGLRREGTGRVEDIEEVLHPLVGTVEGGEVMVLHHPGCEAHRHQACEDRRRQVMETIRTSQLQQYL
jgi:hypothetical protein